MRGRTLLIALIGGGAWTLHLFAGYFVVALGCPRGWPALGWLLGGITVVCAAVAAGVAVAACRGVRRVARSRDDDEAEAHRLLLTVSILLGALFATMIVAGGVAAVALPPSPEAPRGGGA